MNLAVLLLSCTDSPRITDFDRPWAELVFADLADFYRAQSGGRENMQFQIFDWFQLPLTSNEWNNLGFGAGPTVRPMVEAGLNVDLSSFDHFALVIDKFDAALAAVSPTFPIYVHVGAQSLDPALVQHECGHFFGALHANLDTPSGPAEYQDRFCIMGFENWKYSFVNPTLNRPRPDGTIDFSHSDTGPGMAAPGLRACGWLNLAQHAIDISGPLSQGTRRATVQLAPLRGAPPATAPARVCAFADGVVPDQRLLLEFRSHDAWDVGMPPQGAGWIVAHLTGPEERSRLSVQIGAVEAVEGASMVTTKGSVQINVGAASSAGVTLMAEVMSPVPVNRAAPAVATWGRDRLDIVGRGLHGAAYHKAWAQRWLPSQAEWELIGGGFSGPLAVESWGPERLDIFGVGVDQAMWHKAWAQGGWNPPQGGWEGLGGAFTSPPSVASWGPDRLDIFALGTDQAVWHKAWAQQWYPSQNDWESLGGRFINQPAVCSWGPGRLDIFGVGLDKAMFHKAWWNGWHPSPGWEYLGGGFTSPPAVCSWGPDRLDIFALGLDGSMWHKAWAQQWFPSQEGWEPLGGKFLGAPAVASWGPGRIDIFGVGLDGQMYHKAFANGWHPWEQLGGSFSSPPAVVSWGPDRLDIFALGKDFSVRHKTWAFQWLPSQLGWEDVGGAFQ